MIMKKYLNIIIAIAVSVIGLSSCTDLDEKVYDRIDSSV